MMSGSSYSTNCPRCGGHDTVDAYADWKPFDTVGGDVPEMRMVFLYQRKYIERKGTRRN